MKNGVILTALLIVWSLIKLCFKLLGALVQVLASLIVFFGLYIPLFYGVFGIVLLATTDFSLGVGGTDQVLYFVVLGLCGVAAVFISIRNLIVRPLSAVFEPLVEYREDVRKQREEKRMNKARENGEEPMQPYRDPRDYNAGYGQGGYDPYSSQYPYPSPRRPYDVRSYYDDAADGEAYYGNRQGGYPPYYGEEGRRAEPSASRQDRGFAPAPERPLIYYSKRRPGVLVKEYSDRFELFDDSDGSRRYIGTEYKDE